MGEPTAAQAGDVALLRARGRHTRWFGLALFLVFAFGEPVLGHTPAVERPLIALGTLLIMGGGLLRVFCALFIGGWKNQRLTAAGPYALVRNPLYVGSLLATVGVGLATATLSLTVVLLVAVALYYDRTVRREEAFLIQQFGAPYRAYLAAVPRWLPRSGTPLSLPDEVTAKPRYVLRGMRDISVLLGLPLACEAVRAAHASGLLPSFYRLW